MTDLARIPISRRCEGVYLRWYYNGWHYWLWYAGEIVILTEGEKYRTVSTQRMTVGSGQIDEFQIKAIRTIMLTREVYIFTDSGWGVVRVLPGQKEVFNNMTGWYDFEITIVIGSRHISRSGFSPAIVVPVVPPSYEWCETDCIGAQIWMCKNYDINYPGSKVYDNDEANRAIYGGLYTWNQIMAAGFVPEGWHVPTLDEWLELITEVGGDAVAGGELKEVGTDRWNAPNTGAVDTYGFTAVGGGDLNRWTLAFENLKDIGFFWTATESSGSNAMMVYMSHDSAAAVIETAVKDYYFSVRLVKDEVCEEPHLITDDWFLPSADELKAMFDNLALYGLGNFSTNPLDCLYWSSSEFFLCTAWSYNFVEGGDDFNSSSKYEINRIRPCRTFITSTGNYLLRDQGETGGLVFYIEDIGGGESRYYEAAINDIPSAAWSNITDVDIGTTSTDIGEGQNNTNEIMAQAGHVNSAAKDCDELIIIVP